jgi:hypothetical protein
MTGVASLNAMSSLWIWRQRYELHIVVDVVNSEFTIERRVSVGKSSSVASMDAIFVHLLPQAQRVSEMPRALRVSVLIVPETVRCVANW